MDGLSTSNDPNLGTVQWSPLSQDASKLGLDHPIVVGEWNNGGTGSSALMTTLLNNNFAGAWAWSFNAGTHSLRNVSADMNAR
jgi:hypothetical protein